MLELKKALFATLFALSCASLVALTGCEEEGPFERSGEQADEALEDAGEELEEVGDEIQDRTDG